MKQKNGSILSPLTGTNRVRVISIFNSKDIIRGWKESFNIDITEEIGGIKEIILYECDQTKLKFFVHQLLQAAVLFTNNYKGMNGITCRRSGNLILP